MRYQTQLLLFTITALVMAACTRSYGDKHPEKEIDRKISALVSQMTLEEKAGQMTQVTLDVLTEGESSYVSNEPLVLDTNTLNLAFGKYHIGSVLNTANNRARDKHQWNRLIGQIQESCLLHSRLKIPVLYGLDMIHGASYVSGATLFPQQIGMAATWNPALIERAGEITAYETRAIGCPWTFSPVLDLGVDPRWPRQWETFGEDPLLAAIMGEALIQGLQGNGNDLSQPTRIAACMKHYLGYSQTVSGKDRTPALIPMNVLREYHLPAFRKAVETGALTVMINSGEINGLPVHASHQLITGLLKEELGFQGFVVTDWGDIEYLHTRHKIASTQKEAVKIAINAGIDMSMVPYNFDFPGYVVELVSEGEIPMSRIDDAVSRILKVKLLLGLFENPTTTQENYPDFASENFASDARRTALESITLLKNDHNLLPLPYDAKILVCGPAANTMRPLLGGWSYSWQGNLVNEFTEKYPTIYEAIRDLAINPAQVMLEEGVTYSDTGDYRNEIKQDLRSLLNKARQADYIVVCTGENSYTETPGNTTTLDLSENQQELIKTAASSGKPVILVLAQGRPRLIREVEPLSGAILNAYLPGSYGGEAVARILFGETNPSGKLPYTYPKFAYSLEPYYHKPTEALTGVGAPEGSGFDPQYEFGFGMSYAQFSFSDLKLNQTTYTSGETLKVNIKIHNHSGKTGMEVVQVYVSDHFASNTPPVKRLKAFTKILLQAGESRELTLEFPVNDLAFVNQENETLLEKGEFTLIIDSLKQTINVSETKVLKMDGK
ncbi:MAG: glycoside hydrolase family 3 C-terminal domain-containing protein [Lentimicrobium sp.]|jgi:beta-glucosidase|nr:glycoside hydrolase family 3 C-terminal domain-containing protein [Lentimicrobium sp.]MDD2529060.1 glycoside hydrolase family 3 N-terminal domain-containing protein [Lentimicrobiaceae bacterium]MDY0026985.1 glycoside hydrolase family 3 N-terminal domain-containing protein [Lentimicrobium sp.]